MFHKLDPERHHHHHHHDHGRDQEVGDDATLPISSQIDEVRKSIAAFQDQRGDEGDGDDDIVRDELESAIPLGAVSGSRTTKQRSQHGAGVARRADGDETLETWEPDPAPNSPGSPLSGPVFQANTGHRSRLPGPPPSACAPSSSLAVAARVAVDSPTGRGDVIRHNCRGVVSHEIASPLARGRRPPSPGSPAASPGTPAQGSFGRNFEGSSQQHHQQQHQQQRQQRPVMVVHQPQPPPSPRPLSPRPTSPHTSRTSTPEPPWGPAPHISVATEVGPRQQPAPPRQEAPTWSRELPTEPVAPPAATLRPAGPYFGRNDPGDPRGGLYDVYDHHYDAAAIEASYGEPNFGQGDFEYYDDDCFEAGYPDALNEEEEVPESVRRRTYWGTYQVDGENIRPTKTLDVMMYPRARRMLEGQRFPANIPRREYHRKREGPDPALAYMAPQPHRHGRPHPYPMCRDPSPEEIATGPSKSQVLARELAISPTPQSRTRVRAEVRSLTPPPPHNAPNFVFGSSVPRFVSPGRDNAKAVPFSEQRGPPTRRCVPRSNSAITSRPVRGQQRGCPSPRSEARRSTSPRRAVSPAPVAGSLRAAAASRTKRSAAASSNQLSANERKRLQDLKQFMESRGLEEPPPASVRRGTYYGTYDAAGPLPGVLTSPPRSPSPSREASPSQRKGPTAGPGGGPWQAHEALGDASSGSRPPDALYMGFRNPGGERDGYGVMRGLDGSVYSGQWARGCRDGRGTLFFSGGVFEGQWRNGHADGEGIVHFKNGDVFRGWYQCSQKSGEGIYRWSDGAEEVGNYHRGKKHGWHHWWHQSEHWDLLYDEGKVVTAQRAECNGTTGVACQTAMATAGLASQRDGGSTILRTRPPKSAKPRSG